MARAWIELMRRLDYKRFVAQGGDVGGQITDAMAVEAPKELVGMHANFLFALPQDISNTLQAGAPPPSDLSEQERRALQKLQGFFAKNAGYAIEMATRPQTLYGLADSPVALAAWLIDHGDGDDQPAATVLAAMRTPTEGQPPEKLTRDDVLDNITLYWLTNTGVSSARSYWDNKPPTSVPRNSPSPRHLPSSPARSTSRRGAGPKEAIRTSPTSTRRTRAVTSRHGKSRCSSRRRCVRRSSRCGSSGSPGAVRHDVRAAPCLPGQPSAGRSNPACEPMRTLSFLQHDYQDTTVDAFPVRAFEWTARQVRLRDCSGKAARIRHGSNPLAKIASTDPHAVSTMIVPNKPPATHVALPDASAVKNGLAPVKSIVQ
jgi:hypothetical protein